MRPRRHTRSAGDPAQRAIASRRFLRDLALVAATALLGYGLSAYWLSPTSIFAREHAVPRVLELPDAVAREKLSRLGFRPRIAGERSSPAVPAGSVVWQDPPDGTVLPPNGVVLLVLSSGPAAVAVPDVVGFDDVTASKVLAAAGIRVGSVDSVAGGPEPGVVLATRPGAGVARPPGGSVGLVVSRGPAGAS